MDVGVEDAVDLLPRGIRAAVIEFSQESGEVTTIKHLQKALGVAQTGTLGPSTLASLRVLPPERVQAELVKVRIHYLATIVMAQPSKVKLLGRWLDQAMAFFPTGHGHAHSR